MAKNDNHDSRDHATLSQNHGDNRNQGARSTGTAAKSNDRDRRRDRVVEGVKSRPYTAAAVATVAAGAAAFFLTRNKADKPLMKWGQQANGDTKAGAGASKQQGSTSQDSVLETASSSPSSSAGTGAGSGASSPSAIQASSMSSTAASTNASRPDGTGTSSSGSSDNPNTGTSNTAGAAFGGGSSNSSGGGMASGSSSTSSNSGSQTSSAMGNSGLDDTAKDQTKTGAISYGA